MKVFPSGTLNTCHHSDRELSRTRCLKKKQLQLSVEKDIACSAMLSLSDLIVCQSSHHSCCIFFYQTVTNCSLLLAFVRHCSLLFVIVRHCSPLFVTVRHCLSLFVTVRHCLSLFVTVRHCSSLFVTVCHCLSLSVTVCHCSSLFVTVRHSSSLSNFVCFLFVFFSSSLLYRTSAVVNVTAKKIYFFCVFV